MTLQELIDELQYILDYDPELADAPVWTASNPSWPERGNIVAVTMTKPHKGTHNDDERTVWIADEGVSHYVDRYASHDAWQGGIEDEDWEREDEEW